MAVLRVKHLARLVREVFSYSAANRSWWLIPLMVFLGLVALAVVTTQAAVPYAVYTLF